MKADKVIGRIICVCMMLFITLIASSFVFLCHFGGPNKVSSTLADIGAICVFIALISLFILFFPKSDY